MPSTDSPRLPTDLNDVLVSDLTAAQLLVLLDTAMAIADAKREAKRILMRAEGNSAFPLPA